MVTGRGSRRVALVTGGSRGIGAATALHLARRGCDVALTYRNKAARANEVVATIEAYGARGLAVQCDMTRQEDVERLCARLRSWSDELNVVVLNASGGLERDLVAADPRYPIRLNRDAQLAVVDAAVPLMRPGGVIIFVTSHWAHLHGQVVYPDVYGPVAATKYAGEQALRARQGELDQAGLRLLVVSGDLIEGTITPRLLERSAPGIWDQRREAVGTLPTADDMGAAIAAAAVDQTLPGGHTVVVGGALESVPRPPQSSPSR